LSVFVAASTACSPATGFTAGKTQSPAAAGKPLTKLQLTKALITDTDISGFTVESQAMDLLHPNDIVTSSPTDCQPIADIMSVRPVHRRQAMAWATFKPTGTADGDTPGSVTLSSHTSSDAMAWMADLKKALATCTAFTATSQAGWTYRFTVQNLSPAKAGDGSVAYLLTNTRAPDGKGNVVSVVRTGSTLATFLNSEGRGKPAAVPESLARQQHGKLQAAAGD
jgi:hypothetical protein